MVTASLLVGSVPRLQSAASDQSRLLASRDVYIERVAALRAQYPEGDVPRPAHWSGYRVAAREIEFWQERPFRLHDRIAFARFGPADSWRKTRLYP